MLEKSHDPIFIHRGKQFSAPMLKKNAVLPFKAHPQFPLMIDCLSRKYDHHLFLTIDFSHRLYAALIESFYHHLMQETVPHRLRQAEFFFFEENPTEKEWQDFQHQFMMQSHDFIIAINHPDWIPPALLHHSRCRMIAMRHPKEAYPQSLPPVFTAISLSPPSDTDMLSALKYECHALETFHQVIITDEAIAYAHALAGRYLSAKDTFEKTLLLLDSASARAKATTTEDIHGQIALPLTLITDVVSTWTQVPTSHLSLQKFKPADFIQQMQQRIFGQDAALTLISKSLQQSFVQLRERSAPLCSLLFVGPQHAGKKTTAIAMAEYLFNQLDCLYIAESLKSQTSLLAIKLKRASTTDAFNHVVTLKQVIQETPHAILFLPDIEQASPALSEELYELLSTGSLQDQLHDTYLFRQSILLLSSSVGANALTQLATLYHAQEEEPSAFNLMQLIMPLPKAESAFHDAPEEIVDELLPEISATLPASFCQYTSIIPFFPLDKTAIERIIRLKLKLLGRMLDARYGIELGYAPEVIRFLAAQVLQKEKEAQGINIEKALKQLYYTIESAILSQLDHKNCPTQLFLQLNETGQLLRCDWLMTPPSGQHTP